MTGRNERFNKGRSGSRHVGNPKSLREKRRANQRRQQMSDWLEIRKPK